MRKITGVFVVAPLLLGGSAIFAAARAGDVACGPCNNTDDFDNCTITHEGAPAHSFSTLGGDADGDGDGDGSRRKGFHTAVDCGKCSVHQTCGPIDLAEAALDRVDAALEDGSSLIGIIEEYRTVLAVNLEAGTVSLRDCDGKMQVTREMLPSQLDDFVRSE